MEKHRVDEIKKFLLYKDNMALYIGLVFGIPILMASAVSLCENKNEYDAIISILNILLLLFCSIVSSYDIYKHSFKSLWSLSYFLFLGYMLFFIVIIGASGSWIPSVSRLAGSAFLLLIQAGGITVFVFILHKFINNKK